AGTPARPPSVPRGVSPSRSETSAKNRRAVSAATLRGLRRVTGVRSQTQRSYSAKSGSTVSNACDPKCSRSVSRYCRWYTRARWAQVKRGEGRPAGDEVDRGKRGRPDEALGVGRAVRMEEGLDAGTAVGLGPEGTREVPLGVGIDQEHPAALLVGD